MKKILFIAAMCAMFVGITGCKRAIRNTTVYVEDSIRHYFPIRQGEQLSILYKIENTGKDPYNDFRQSEKEVGFCPL